MSPHPMSTETRQAQWRGAVEMELQDLIKQASHYRAQIDQAKTKLKKDYFAKKMKKVTTEVIRMLNALESIKRQQTQTANDNVAAGVPLEYAQDTSQASPEVEYVPAGTSNEQVPA